MTAALTTSCCLLGSTREQQSAKPVCLAGITRKGRACALPLVVHTPKWSDEGALFSFTPRSRRDSRHSPGNQSGVAACGTLKHDPRRLRCGRTIPAGRSSFGNGSINNPEGGPMDCNSALSGESGQRRRRYAVAVVLDDCTQCCSWGKQSPAGNLTSNQMRTGDNLAKAGLRPFPTSNSN